jgi:hypothetical protein
MGGGIYIYIQYIYTFLMFCWPCIIVHQYSETNVMHFLFNLLRINGLYMFRPLLAHPQEALHSGTWYIACVLCQLAATRTGVELVSPTPVPLHWTTDNRKKYGVTITLTSDSSQAFNLTFNIACSQKWTQRQLVRTYRHYLRSCDIPNIP